MKGFTLPNEDIDLFICKILWTTLARGYIYTKWTPLNAWPKLLSLSQPCSLETTKFQNAVIANFVIWIDVIVF